MPETPKPLKIFFHSMDGVGHLNACVGIAQALAARGHRIIFLLNSAFKGQFVKYNFEEIILVDEDENKNDNDANSIDANNNNINDDTIDGNGEEDPKENVDPVKRNATIILNSGFIGPKSPKDKLKDMIEKNETSFSANLFRIVMKFHRQLSDAIRNEKPDLIVLDHFLVAPVIMSCGVPWVQLYSSNPLFLYNSDRLPPCNSGYSTKGDPKEWQEFRELNNEHLKLMFKSYQEKLFDHYNYKLTKVERDIADRYMIQLSPYLNIYGCPKELDYTDIVPKPDNFASVDAFCRIVSGPFELPEKVARKSPTDRLIYFTLGSMGSIDVELMKRVIGLLAQTPYKVIVSKGPRASEYSLPGKNFWGEATVPQTKILPLVDLVITHGGNNTVTETFTFGKPMIVMPLFADQYDNAQRIDDKGYGVRIDPYTFKDETLLEAVERLVNDMELKKQLQQVAKRIEEDNSKEKVCIRMEELVENFVPLE